MKDPWADPEIKRWKRHVEEEVVPMIERSGVVISIAPQRKAGPDVKFAVELGMAIMLDKPIIVVAETNDDVPPLLRRVAARIVVGDITDPEFQAHFQRVLTEMMES